MRPFLMALAEFPDHETTPLRDPDALADQLALLVEGVYASVPQALAPGGPASQARHTAETIIAASE